MTQRAAPYTTTGKGGTIYAAGQGTRFAADWYCPTCIDLQYRDNPKCRICELPREQGISSLIEIGDPATLWLGSHEIEQAVVERFLATPKEVQMTIINTGSLVRARDPTGYLIKALNDANAPWEGDWYCGKCYDFQFAKNDKCRKCGALKSQNGQEGPPDPQAFLRSSQIQPEVEEKFFALSPELQKSVMECGSLLGAEDPSGILSLRIRRFVSDPNSGKKGKAKGKDKGKDQGKNTGQGKGKGKGDSGDGKSSWEQDGRRVLGDADPWEACTAMMGMMEEMLGKGKMMGMMAEKGGKGWGNDSWGKDSWGKDSW